MGSKTVLKRLKYICPISEICPFTAYQYRQMDIHVMEAHTCAGCGDYFEYLDTHECPTPEQEGRGILGPLNLELGAFEEHESGQRGILKSFMFTNDDESLLDIADLFAKLSENVTRILDQLLEFHRGIRVQFNLHVLMRYERIDAEATPYLTTPFYTLLHPNFIPDIIFSAVEFIRNSVVLWNARGSGFSLVKIMSLTLVTAKYQAFRGRGGKIPKSLKGRRGILDVNCPTGYCFQYSLVGALHHSEVEEKDRKKGKSYGRFLANYDFSMLNFPVDVHKLKAFENANSICVNVYSVEEKDVYPVKISEGQFEKVVSLLLVNEGEESHYVGIIDFDALMGMRGNSKKFWCPFCCNPFTNLKVRDSHQEVCRGFGTQTVKMPERNEDGSPTVLKFKEFYKLWKFSHRMYCDFETLNSDPTRPSTGSVKYLKEFIPLSWGLLYIPPTNKAQYFQDAGPNCLQSFVETVLRLADIALEEMKEDIGVPELTPEERKDFEEAQSCPLCKRPFSAKLLKHLHHNHTHCSKAAATAAGVKNNYVSALCADCNLQIKPRSYIPCVLHNSTHFDNHLIAQAMRFKCVKKVDVLPINSENWSCITLNGKVKFYDSYGRLNGSLDKLIEVAKQNKMDFKFTAQIFADKSEHLPLLISKQAFCYDWVDSYEKLDYQGLPEKNYFYNTLTESYVSDEKYDQAKQLYKIMGCTNFGDFNFLYQRLDVTCLADIFENYRETSISIYGLDVFHAVSAAGYSFASMMYNTRTEFETIHDIDLLVLLRSMCRGGITNANRRLCDSNIPGTRGFNPSLPSQVIKVYDLNSLYAHIMRSSLPQKDFKKLTDAEIVALSADNFSLLRKESNDNTAYFLVVDFFTPPELHDYLKDLPCGPVKMNVQHDFLSDMQREMLEERGIKSIAFKTERLLLTLFPKVKYGIHSKLLAFYMYLGIVVTKLHGGYSFTEAPMVKSFIERNIKLRADSKDDMRKGALKTSSNSLYGLFIFNESARSNVGIALNPTDALRLVSKPTFSNFVQLHENVTLVTWKKPVISYRLPYYCGIAILELSKLKFYRTYYQKLFDVFPDRRLSLIYCDSDSFVVRLDLKPGENSIDHVIQGRNDLFDFSNFDKTHVLFDDSVKGVSGLLKDEYPGDEIQSIVCLAPKMYCIKFWSDLEQAKGKGIPRLQLAKLRFEQYKQILFAGGTHRVTSKQIRSKDQHLFLVSIDKIGLSNMSMKNYLIPPYGIETLPYGHKDIPRE